MAGPMDEQRDGLDAVASRRRVLRWSAGVFAGSVTLLGLAACGGGGGDEDEDEGGGNEGEGEEEEDD